jgi:hypothetical protein
MIKKSFEESGFIFNFAQCVGVEKADELNVEGLKSVDFIVETKTCSLYIEVKNPDNPRAREYPAYEKFYQNIKSDQTKFPLEIGMKVKDSLLKQYALGKTFTKPIQFVLILQADNLTFKERTHLSDRIRGYIPTGLNHDDFQNFTNIKFDFKNMREFQEKYGEYVEITEVRGAFTTTNTTPEN